MDLETARTLTRQLWPPASEGGPGGELEWTIAQTLANQFAAEPLATLAQPSEGAAWLLFEGSLHQGESRPDEGEGGEFSLRGWPLTSAAWRVSLDSHGATLNLGQPGLETNWGFSFEGQSLLEIKGKIALERDPKPDEDERFARLLASSVGWSALA